MCLPAFHSAIPSEPPLPYPPPPPFVPLRAGDVDDQIGLLKPYYHNRFALLVASSAPSIAVPPAPLPGPVLGPSPLSGNNPSLPGNQPANHSNISNPPPPPAPVQAPPPPDLILPDDVPNPSQLKMSPIGQIMKSSGAGGGTKKKGKVVVEGSVGIGSGASANVVAGAAAPAAATVLSPSAVPVAVGMSGTRLIESGTPKKKKSGTGVGTGNGRKKTVPPLFPQPMVVS